MTLVCWSEPLRLGVQVWVFVCERVVGNLLQRFFRQLLIRPSLMNRLRKKGVDGVWKKGILWLQ